MSDTEPKVTELTEREPNNINNSAELNEALTRSVNTVYKQYLYELQNNPVIVPSEAFLDENEDNLRMIKLKELSCKKGEDIFQKLSTVYNASMSIGCSLYVMIDVTSNSAPADIYIGLRYKGVQSDGIMQEKLNTSFSALKNGLNSNFPGTRFETISDKGKLIDDIFGDYSKYISSVSCVASTRDKSKTENKSFVQGIERFIDTMQGNTYTAIFLAEPLTHDEQAEIRSGYETLYSTLSSFRKSAWSYSESDSNSVMESLTKGISDTVTDGIANTQTHGYNLGANLSTNAGGTNGHAIGSSITEGNYNSKSTPDLISQISSVAGGVAKVAATVLTLVNPAAGAVAGVASSSVNCIGGLFQGRTLANGKSKSWASSISNSIGSYFGGGMGINGGIQNSNANTQSESESHSENENRTAGTTKEHSTGKTLQIETINKHIDEMLTRIDEQIKRCREGEDYGSYSCSAYILSSKQENCMLAANTYRALMLGDGSSVESGAINLWNGNSDQHKAVVPIMKQYLRRFVHPVFAMPISFDDNNISAVPYSPGNIVSGLELPMHLGMPTRSVYGLPVIEHAEFGRNIAYQSENTNGYIEMGKIYHMGKIEGSNVNIDIDSLASHTFITGSTGAGKSNTIYNMLDKLSKKSVKFLVVEPAKGEYGSVLGLREDVTVYGTNPRKNVELLRIDPFSFPEDIHVLEHMDRLIEIFNVCWPMYAAMPAVLKDAVERAYSAAGWNLEMSVNKFGEPIFPTFSDVLEQIRIVINESDYSSENKSDYTGSLVTRIHSLTNGINGLIFTSDEIGNELLFDSNSIVDLSRVGSSETKSLIMGLLVLKLQEYRMSMHNVNATLNHVTVLEEAHNLLKRTSTEQISEGANLLGKSVEMLSNSIAEMRTYGEGFIIADQAPGLLDMSVIRNTNTKIIMRLPDISDRELVGKAAGLNDDQITELAKLDKGVAAVYQSRWLEPVLCKVNRYESAVDYKDVSSANQNLKLNKSNSLDWFTNWILNQGLYNKIDKADYDLLKSDVLKSRLSASVKCRFIKYYTGSPDQSADVFRSLIFDYFHADKAFRTINNSDDIIDWIKSFINNLNPTITTASDKQLGLLAGSLLREKSGRDSRYLGKLYEFTKVFKLKEGNL